MPTSRDCRNKTRRREDGAEKSGDAGERKTGGATGTEPANRPERKSRMNARRRRQARTSERGRASGGN